MSKMISLSIGYMILEIVILNKNNGAVKHARPDTTSVSLGHGGDLKMAMARCTYHLCVVYGRFGLVSV